LADLFPGSSQARLIGLDRADDRILWNFAKENNYTLVSLDADFAEIVALLGPPPKVIWLRCGNQPTAVIEKVLRDHAEAIAVFWLGSAACLEIY